MNTEDLLAHADFVRALARTLVLDEHAAADITQQTWLAALEHPPGPGSMRAWLSRVTRNFALKRHRSEKRRAAHEEDAAVYPGVPTPEEIAVREEARRSMIDALLELDEPYRSTVILRFYEDLSAHEVAERMKVPVETVRTRIKRGLDRMRSRLDSGHGGRKAWGLALAPFVGLKLDPLPVAAGMTALLPGVIIMTTKLKISLAAVLVLLAGAVLYQSFPEFDSDVPAPPVEETAIHSELDEETPQDPPVMEETVPETREEKVQIPPEGTFVAGRVTEKETGEAITTFNVTVLIVNGPDTEVILDEMVHSADGTFFLPMKRSGTFQMAIQSASHRQKFFPSVEVPRRGGKSGLDAELERGYEITGRVLDDATGRPIPDVLIMPWGKRVMKQEFELAKHLAGEEVPYPFARTGSDGRFTLEVVADYAPTVAALHPDYVLATGPLKKGEEHELRLNRGFRVHGRALDEDGEPCEGLNIYVSSKASMLARAATTGADGRYESAPMPPGWVYLHANPEWSLVEEPLNFVRERKRGKLVDRDIEVDFGPTGEHVTWRGVFYGEEGEPIPGGNIFVYPSEMILVESMYLNMVQKVETDEEGRFEVPRLQMGTYGVTIYSEEHRYRDWGEEVFDLPGIIERDIRLSLPMLSGVMVDATTGQPLTGKYGQLLFRDPKTLHLAGTCSMNDKGRFTIKHLPPGTFDVVVNVYGCLSYQKVMSLTVKEGEPIEELRIEIMPGGTVQVHLTGFTDTVPGEVHFIQEGGKASSFPVVNREKDGAISGYQGEAGPWKAAVYLDGLGFVEREFEMIPGENVVVKIDRSDFNLHEGEVEVHGTLRHADGSPARSAELRFRAWKMMNLEPKQGILETRTDKQGRFMLKGFRPGYWHTSARLPDMGEIFFPDTSVPMDPKRSIAVDLVLSDGTVAASLWDRAARKPVETEKPRITLYNMKTLKNACLLEEIKKEGGFALKGIPEGKYELHVRVPGYFDYQSPAFSISAGQSFKLNRVGLEPCGSIFLEVIDGKGESLEAYSLLCNDVKQPFTRRIIYDSGSCCFNNLPLGEVKVTVSAEGYKAKEIELDLKQGAPEEIRLMLDPL